MINTLLSSNKLTVTPSIPGSPASWIPFSFKSSNTKSPIELVTIFGIKPASQSKSFELVIVKLAVCPPLSASLSKLSVVASCGLKLNVG